MHTLTVCLIALGAVAYLGIGVYAAGLMQVILYRDPPVPAWVSVPLLVLAFLAWPLLLVCLLLPVIGVFLPWR